MRSSQNGSLTLATPLRSPVMGRHLYAVLGTNTRALALPDCCKRKLRSVQRKRESDTVKIWFTLIHPPSPLDPIN
jgi:hypothetical protein